MSRKRPGRVRLGRILILLMIPLLLAGAVYGLLRRKPEKPPVVVTETAEEESGYITYAITLDEVHGIPVNHVYIPYDSSRRPGEIREIRFLTIHETDNRSSGADALAHSNWLIGDTTDITSWHYTVDDHSIYHNLPDNEIAWNAGDNRSRDGGNMNGIGIEMCVNVSGDFDQTVRNTAWLCAELLQAYGLTPDDVYLHRDFMGKICPHRLITENKVTWFKELVQADYDELQAAAAAEAPTETEE
ncbi:MAG: N-acetylmuramoyl-L-alanine amidase [Solobacterium sp.]|nr:N-acetylmuramoyl-L-alanine amidase [Solobacterium sp.]MBR3127295.1 N-acetylmuramoyl-L-alanine amidase [Solobacterium sp.]